MINKEVINTIEDISSSDKLEKEERERKLGPFRIFLRFVDE